MSCFSLLVCALVGQMAYMSLLLLALVWSVVLFKLSSVCFGLVSCSFQTYFRVLWFGRLSFLNLLLCALVWSVVLFKLTSVCFSQLNVLFKITSARFGLVGYPFQTCFCVLWFGRLSFSNLLLCALVWSVVPFKLTSVCFGLVGCSL